MPVPWLAVGNLVLGNLDKILDVVRPGFTRRKIEAVDAQADLLNQQIGELQSAALANTEQIRALAAQLKEVVSGLEQAAATAARERAATRRISYVACALAVAALVMAGFALAT
jgi:hypothetical protein